MAKNETNSKERKGLKFLREGDGGPLYGCGEFVIMWKKKMKERIRPKKKKEEIKSVVFAFWGGPHKCQLWHLDLEGFDTIGYGIGFVFSFPRIERWRLIKKKKKKPMKLIFWHHSSPLIRTWHVPIPYFFTSKLDTYSPSKFCPIVPY